MAGFAPGSTGERVCWYVNFERPYVRTAVGVDTFDLLVIESQAGPFAGPDDSWHPDASWPTPELPPDMDLA